MTGRCQAVRREPKVLQAVQVVQPLAASLRLKRSLLRQDCSLILQWPASGCLLASMLCSLEQFVCSNKNSVMMFWHVSFTAHDDRQSSTAMTFD